MDEAKTETDTRTGGCDCGALRYKTTGTARVSGQCHCKPCQHLAGGGVHYFQLVDPDGFEWTSGTPASFARLDIENACTRSFCPTCGTQIVTQRADQRALVLKIGSLDDTSDFSPEVALCHAQAQAFHHVPEGVQVFDAFPPRR